MLNIGFNDFELEFLKLFDIELKDDSFINIVTGDKFAYENCIDSGNIITSKRKYCFISPHGEIIEFKRENRDRQQSILTVDYIYDDYHHWAQERFDIERNFITERILGMDRVVRYDSKKRISKDSSTISARHENYSDYFFTTVFANYKNFYSTIDIKEMTCSLSSIYTNAIHRHQYRPFEFDDIIIYDSKTQLSKENYILQLTESINKIFKDNNYMRLFYLRMIPYLLKCFESSLEVPIIYRDYFVNRLENRKRLIRKVYKENDMFQKLKEVDEMYDYLDNYYKSLKAKEYKKE